MKSMRILGAAIASLLLVLASAPAHAATRERPDATGDVSVRTCDVTPESTPDYVCSWVHAPRQVNGDISFVRARHFSDRVVVFTKFRALDRFDGDQTLRVRVWLPDGTGRTAFVARWAGNPLFIDMEHSDGDEYVCNGMFQRTDWALNTMRVVIPRRCLANASWVRVGVRYEIIRAGDSSRVYVDEAFRSQPTTSDTYGLSGRIYRG